MKALRLEGVTVRDIDIEDKLEELQRALFRMYEEAEDNAGV